MEMKPDDIEIEAEEQTELAKDAVDEIEEPEGDEAKGPRLVLKRNGAETDISFGVHAPATIGRFDPSVGPIDIDLGEIPEGSYVSRKHARITCDDDAWMIEDLGSSNGTFILREDFEQVQAADLEDGMEIALGNARFVFYAG